MQVQKINNQTFTSGISNDIEGKRRTNIDAAIALSDSDLKKMAYYQACLQTNDKKHKQVNNAIVLSLPAVAAVSDAILTRGQSVELLGAKISSGPAARLLTGAKTLGKWYGALAIATAVIAGVNKLQKESSKFKQFVKDQPFTTVAAEIAASLALIVSAEKTLPKVVQKLISGKSPQKTWIKIAKGVANFDKNNIVKSIAKNYTKMSDRMPPALKTAGIAGLAAAPLLIGGCAILHAFDHSSIRNRQASQNYAQLKASQAVLAQARAAELEQN